MASFQDGNVTNVVMEIAPLSGEGEPVHRRILSDIRGAETCYALSDGVVAHATATTDRYPSSTVSLHGVAAYGAATHKEVGSDVYPHGPVVENHVAAHETARSSQNPFLTIPHDGVAAHQAAGTFNPPAWNRNADRPVRLDCVVAHDAAAGGDDAIEVPDHRVAHYAAGAGRLYPEVRSEGV